MNGSDLLSICRICARKDDCLKSMFKSENEDFAPQFSLVEAFAKLTGIKISKDDRLSHLICKRCCTILSSAMLLRSLALATDHKLQMRLNKKDNIELSKFENGILRPDDLNFKKCIETGWSQDIIKRNNVNVTRSETETMVDINDYENKLFAKYFPKTAESMKETTKSHKTDISNISEKSVLNPEANVEKENDEQLIKNSYMEKKLFLKYFPKHSGRDASSDNECLEHNNELDLFKKYFPDTSSNRDTYHTSLFDDTSCDSTFYEDAVSNSDSNTLNTDDTCKLNTFAKVSVNCNKDDLQNHESTDRSTKSIDQNIELSTKNERIKRKSQCTISNISKNRKDISESNFVSTEVTVNKYNETCSTDNLVRTNKSNGDLKEIDRDKIERDVMTLLKNGYLYVRKGGSHQTALAKSKAKKPYNFEYQSRKYRSILVGPYRGADVPAQCKICKKVLATIRSLKKHAQVHFGFTHICEYCGHGFRTFAAMDAHMMARHGKEKKFVCQHCQHRACSKHELHEHELRHTGVRPYICDTCGNSFARRPCLVKHIGRIHTAVKSFKCEQCGKRFFSSADLRNHDNSVHVRRFMYECERCGARYAKRSSVRQHLAGAHDVPRETQGHVRRVCVL